MNLKEILRYLGYGQNEPENRMVELIKECYEELAKVAEPKYVAKRVDVSVLEDGTIHLGDVSIRSKDLAKNLEGCHEAVVFATTLGIGTDMLMNRFVKLDIVKASILQACGAAMIEDYIDEYQKGLSDELSEAGFSHRPRFSPGFGDFYLEYQKEIFQILNPEKNIGVHLTEGGVMVPEKSVTAIIGIKRK